MSKRDRLAKRLSELRAELTGKQLELSALVIQPGAQTSNATRISNLIKVTDGLRDEVDQLTTEIDAIDQAAIFASRKALPVTDRSRELSTQAAKLATQRDKLTGDLDRVRGDLGDKLDQLSPGVLAWGGDALRLVGSVTDLRAREAQLIAAIDFVDKALTEASKQINSEAVNAARLSRTDFRESVRV